MTFSENDQEDVFVKRPLPKSKHRAVPGGGKQYHYQQHGTTPHTRPIPTATTPQQQQPEDSSDGFSAAVSWPILLAIVPTVGSFFAGSADAWSDFVMILLILFYVYKWMTGMH